MRLFLPILLGFLTLLLALTLIASLLWALPLPVVLKVTVLEGPGGKPLANVPVNIFIENGVWIVDDFNTSTDASGCFGLVSHRARAPSAMLSFLEVETLSFNIEEENDRLFEGLFRAKIADLDVGKTLYSVDGSVYLSPEASQLPTYTLEVLGRTFPFGGVLRPREDVCATGG